MEGEEKGLGGKFHVQRTAAVVIEFRRFEILFRRKDNKKKEKRSVEFNAQSPFNDSFRPITYYTLESTVICPPNYTLSILKQREKGNQRDKKEVAI